MKDAPTGYTAIVLLAAVGLGLAAGSCRPSGGDGGSRADAPGTDGGDDPPKTGEPVDDRGPGTVLDVRAAQQPEGLNLELSRENSGDLRIRGALGSAEVYEIDMTFESQTLWSRTWVHRASLFVPERTADEAPQGAFVIVQGGTRNPTDVSGPSSYRGNYAGFLAAALGIPAMVVSNIPGEVDLRDAPASWQSAGPARCFSGGLAQQRYVPCLLEVLRRTGDLQADPFRYVARAWMRALTAGRAAAERAAAMDWPEGRSPPDFRASRALLLADGVRGVGARMAAVADNRVDGVFANADFVDIPVLVDAIASRWREERGWFRRPGAFGEWLESSTGADWRTAVDPASWSDDLVRGRSWVDARGTNDERYPLVQVNRVRSAFPPAARSVTVPGYASGIGSRTHLASWYGFVASRYLGAEVPGVQATVDARDANVEMTAQTEGGTVDSVRAIWTKQQSSSDDGDYRDTTWSRTELTQEGEGWSGQFTPIAEHVGSYAAVRGEVEVPSVAEGESTLTIQPVWSSRMTLFEP